MADELKKWEGPINHTVSRVSWIIAGLSALLLLTGLILFFFVFKPFARPSADAAKLVSETNRLVVNVDATKTDNTFWLDVDKNVRVVSADLYNADMKKVGAFKKDADNAGKFTVTIEVPIDKTREMKYFAKYNTDSFKDIATKPVSLRVAGAWPDVYYESDAQTKIALDRLLKEPSYARLTKRQQAEKAVEFLNSLNSNDRNKGEAWIKAGSVKYDSSNHTVEYVMATGHRNEHIPLDPVY